MHRDKGSGLKTRDCLWFSVLPPFFLQQIGGGFAHNREVPLTDGRRE